MIDESKIVKKTKMELDCYWLGPFTIINEDGTREVVNAPFFSTELSVIKATNRGRKISKLEYDLSAITRKIIEPAGGIKVEITRDVMTRAPLLKAKSVLDTLKAQRYIKNNFSVLEEIANSTTSFGRLVSVEPSKVGCKLYLRVGMWCADAAGHTMVEKASIAISKHLERKFNIKLFTVSSNLCTDKKPAKINLDKGRGKGVVAEVVIPKEIVEEKLKTTVDTIVYLNEAKNHLGSELAGCLGGRNSHHGSMIAAVFATTGQDLANISEASMGNTEAEKNEEGNLVFSIYIPCLIVGTIGGGTKFPHARVNLEEMGIYGGGNPPGANAQKLAKIIAAATLAGELSTMAELTKGGRFIEDHLVERKLG